MQYFDVCNGDADGLIARHQYRLSFPVAPSQLTLITGVKRDVALLSRVESFLCAPDADVSVFDVSFDQNVGAAWRLLDAGASIRYFDHHRASSFRPHPRLSAYIDTSANVCTSLIVDHHLNGAHRTWAIAAAFGDNLADIAGQLAESAGLTTQQTGLLQQLGECINYNAYGESIHDLQYPPAEIAQRMLPYRDPFEFALSEAIVQRLLAGFTDDLQRAQAIAPVHASNVAAVYVLPDESWARSVSGSFANWLVHSSANRAHAVLSRATDGTHIVSIRAPLNKPQHADAIAIQFNGGGGRATAAGINSLPAEDIARLVAVLEETYGSGAD